MVFVYSIPVALLLVLNSCLIRAIHRAKRQHATMLNTNKEKDSLSVTVNIVAVVIIFVICQTHDFALVIMSYPSFDVDAYTISIMSAISTMCMAINASVNFVIYFLFYKRFRRTVLLMMCRIDRKSSAYRSRSSSGKSSGSKDPSTQKMELA